MKETEVILSKKIWIRMPNWMRNRCIILESGEGWIHVDTVSKDFTFYFDMECMKIQDNIDREEWIQLPRRCPIKTVDEALND